MNVQYEPFLFPTRGTLGIWVLPGQRITSLQQIAEGVKWSEWGREVIPNKKSIRDILTWLESREMVTVESNAKGTLITVVNWHTYNDYSGFREEKVSGQSISEVTRSGHKEKGIKGKEVKTTKTFSPEALRLSGMLADLILENNAGNTELAAGKRQATVARWGDDIDKIHRLDGQPWEHIEAVIGWCQADSFWSPNILSGVKLRKQFNQLFAKMAAKPASGSANHQGSYADPTRGAI